MWTSYLSPADLYEPTNPTALINVLHTVLSPSTLKRAFGKQSPWAQLHACLQDAATSTNLQDLEDVPWRSAVMQTDAPSVQVRPASICFYHSGQRSIQYSSDIGFSNPCIARRASNRGWPTHTRVPDNLIILFMGCGSERSSRQERAKNDISS